MPPTYKNCQSCGMPFKRDPNGGGSNADGSRSAMYCSHCYVQGRFTRPDITAAEMQELVKGKIGDAGFPGFLAAFFARGVPNLARWRN